MSGNPFLNRDTPPQKKTARQEEKLSEVPAVRKEPHPLVVHEGQLMFHEDWEKIAAQTEREVPGSLLKKQATEEEMEKTATLIAEEVRDLGWGMNEFTAILKQNYPEILDYLIKNGEAEVPAETVKQPPATERTNQHTQSWSHNPLIMGGALSGGYLGNVAAQHPGIQNAIRAQFEQAYNAEVPNPKMNQRMEADARRQGYSSFRVNPNTAERFKEELRSSVDSQGRPIGINNVNLSKTTPPSVAGHELGHLKNLQDSTRSSFMRGHKILQNYTDTHFMHPNNLPHQGTKTWWNPPKAGTPRFGRSLLGSAAVLGITGNEYAAAATPAIMTAPKLIEEGLASGRGLMAIYRTNPKYQIRNNGQTNLKGPVNLLRNHGRTPLTAFGTHAIPRSGIGLGIGAGLLGASYLSNNFINNKKEG